MQSTNPSICLIWNDDHEVALLFKFVCQQHVYQLQYYDTIALAYDHLLQDTPQVIVAKRSLTSLDDGIDFCRYSRSHPQLQHIPIIVGWADLGPDGFERAYQAGANGCFGRVYDIEGIFDEIQALIEDPTRTRLVDQPQMNQPQPSQHDDPY
jgi:CheY-like chemotaxis protein